MNRWIVWIVSLVVLCVLQSCGSSRSLRHRKPVVLSPEEQNRYDYYLLEAVRHQQMERYDVAFELLHHCLSINPYAASAHAQLVPCYIFLKDRQQAIRQMELAVAAAPDNYWYAQGLGGLYMEEKEVDKARKQYESVADRFTDRLDPLYALLEIYNRDEAYDKVIATLNRMEGFLGKTEQISTEKYRIYLQMKDYAAAQREIETLVQEYPAETRYRVMLGDFYIQQKRMDEGYKLYRAILDEEPDNALARYALANYYEEIDDKANYDQQIDSLLFNRKVDPQVKLGVMRSIIVESEQEGRDSTRVYTLFDRIMADDPDEASLPMLYAQFLLSKQRVDQALPVLRKVIDIDPKHTVSRLMLLSEAAKREEYAEIITLCEAGVENNPEMLEFYFYLAIAYNHDERYDEARAICERALEHVNAESSKQMVSDFYAIIGDVAHQKGENNDAYAAYERALEYYPDNVGVLNNYAYYLSLEHRDLDKAEEMSYRTVKAEPNNATYLDTYAWILFEKGNYAQARIYIDEVLKWAKPDELSADVLEHCGDIHALTEDIEGAVGYWKQAMEKGSESKLLKRKISERRWIKP